MKRLQPPPFLLTVLGNLAVAAFYWGFGVPAMRFFSEYGLFPSPIWLPAGIALVAALVGGSRYLPGIFLGSLGINHFSLGAPLIEALVISFTNTLGPWIGARLSRPSSATHPPFYTLHEVLTFTLFGVGLHGLITASGGTLAIALIGDLSPDKLQEVWFTWMLSDAGGALLLAPVLLLWLEPEPAPLWGDWRSGLVFSMMVVAVALLFFLVLVGDPTGHLVGLPYLLFLPMLWVTVRHSPRQANTLLLLVATLAVVGTVSHHGVLYTAPAGKPLENLGLMVVSLSLTVLTVGALVAERRLAEHGMLQDTRRQFAAFMDHLPAAAYIKEPGGQLLFANREFDTLLGRAHALSEPLPPGIASRLVGVDRDAPVSGPRQSEVTDKMPDGEERTFHFVKFPVQRADGTPLIGGIAFDISDRKHMEEALRESETRYRLLAENTSDVIWTMDVNTGRFTYVSPSVEQLRGFTAEEVLAQTPMESVCPESAQMVADGLRHLREHNELPRRTWEFEQPCKDGSRIHSEATVDVIRDHMGRAVTVVGVTRNVTARKKAEEALRTRAVAIESASESVLITDRRGVIEYVNPAFTTTTGFTAEEAVGRTPAILKSGAQDAAFYREMWNTITAGETWSGEIINRRKDGTLYTEATAIAPVKDEAGALLGFVAIKHDVTERKRLEAQLDRMAHFDDLTGLPNRALFFDRLRQTLALAQRNQQRFALLFVDLDGFKEVNDAHGHEGGDTLLRTVARRLSDSVRASDTVARMGGDEFTVILRDIMAPTDASAIAEKIIHAISEPVVLNDKPCQVGASIGISLYPAHGEDVEALLNRADNAMYEVKRSGKGAWRYYEA